MGYKFNVFTGTLDLVKSQAAGSIEDGSLTNPFTSLNFKQIRSGLYYKINEDLENVVTRIQIIDGILIVDGVNTVL